MSPADASERRSFFRDGVAIDPTYDAVRSADNGNARGAKALVESLWPIAAPYVDPDTGARAVRPLARRARSGNNNG